MFTAAPPLSLLHPVTTDAICWKDGQDMFDNLYVAAITAYPVAFGGEKGTVSGARVSCKNKEGEYTSGNMQNANRNKQTWNTFV